MYDLIILGGGAAGLSAAMYAARYKLNVLVIAETIGGTAVEAGIIENWPGTIHTTGIELMESFAEHARSLNVPIIECSVVAVNKTEDGNFDVIDGKDTHYSSKTLIYALGTKRRKLQVPGEDIFTGRGVSYCAICDGPIFKDKIVAVVGGGDAAAMTALILAEHAKRVYIMYRGDDIRAEPITAEKLAQNSKITIMTKTQVKEIKGTTFVEAVVLDNSTEIKLTGIFIEIGGAPATSLAKEIGVECNNSGHIIVNNDQETNISGVFASGDISTKSENLRQVVTSAAEGALAASSAFRYIKRKK